jgi:murein DD-endopeptidase MepM/ murein hydrolase activator NlpD
MRPASSRPVRRLLTTLLATSAALLAVVLPVSLGYADEPTPAGGVWPLDPRPAVARGFDPPATRWGAGHRGVDLAGRPGQPVRSSLPGRIAFAGTLAGRGVVVVDHGATRTTYEPVTGLVSVGDPVQAGTILGRLQTFGSHCFPRACLHWGLIEGRDHYLDPLTIVGAGPVRLLPLDGGPGAVAGRGATTAPARMVPEVVRTAAGPRGASALVRPGGEPGGTPAGADRW